MLSDGGSQALPIFNERTSGAADVPVSLNECLLGNSAFDKPTHGPACLVWSAGLSSRSMSIRVLLLLGAFVAVPVIAAPMVSSMPYTIQIVDGATGIGISGLHVVTDNGIECQTFGQGKVRFDERSLMGRDVHFTIHDDTHQFDSRVDLHVTPGGRATITVHKADNSTS